MFSSALICVFIGLLVGLFVGLSVSNITKSYERILMKFSGNVNNAMRNK